MYYRRRRTCTGMASHFMRFQLHHLARRGKKEELFRLLQQEAADLNEYDEHGRTPLMYAAETRNADVELVRLLIQSGARVTAESSGPEGGRSVVSFALSGGHPAKVALLLDHGAELHYTREHGYDAFVDAVHGRDITRDPLLLDLLRLLISNGVALNTVTSYRESALRVLSRLGRFDAVRLLLEAGADESLLQWTPLIRAVALGRLEDVEAAVKSGHSLEERDWWERTAWLLAVQTGDVARAQLLMDCGADTGARSRCGKTALLTAVETDQTSMLQWLLQMGVAIEEADDFGMTPLMHAVEHANAPATEMLLHAGAILDREKHGQTALSFASTAGLATLLLNAGADPANLSFEARRDILGLDPGPDEGLLSTTAEEFRAGRARRFGRDNPEETDEPFWISMIRAGISAFRAKQAYSGVVDDDSPVWCGQRFGQTLTFLPDGRIVQTGGEHEDFYDEDFCIYNDVFVHSPDGSIRILSYPESLFPPTDFHTATLIGEHIYLIGSLGYPGQRTYGVTPVYRLHTGSFRLEPVSTTGTAPGWLYKHRAIPLHDDEIQVCGGKVVTHDGSQEIHAPNGRKFVLNTRTSHWRLV